MNAIALSVVPFATGKCILAGFVYSVSTLVQARSYSVSTMLRTALKNGNESIAG